MRSHRASQAVVLSHSRDRAAKVNKEDKRLWSCRETGKNLKYYLRMPLGGGGVGPEEEEAESTSELLAYHVVLQRARRDDGGVRSRVVVAVGRADVVVVNVARFFADVLLAVAGGSAPPAGTTDKGSRGTAINGRKCEQERP